MKDPYQVLGVSRGASEEEIKKAYPKAVMSGSGSTYFILEHIENFSLNEEYQFINNLEFISEGTSLAD